MLGWKFFLGEWGRARYWISQVKVKFHNFNYTPMHIIIVFENVLFLWVCCLSGQVCNIAFFRLTLALITSWHCAQIAINMQFLPILSDNKLNKIKRYKNRQFLKTTENWPSFFVKKSTFFQWQFNISTFPSIFFHFLPLSPFFFHFLYYHTITITILFVYHNCIYNN